MVLDLTGEQLLLAFARFASRRCHPLFVVSDNGANFIFVQPLLRKTANIHDVKFLDPKVASYFMEHRIQWHFIPVYAPWYGGVYERLVGIVK